MSKCIEATLFKSTIWVSIYSSLSKGKFRFNLQNRRFWMRPTISFIIIISLIMSIFSVSIFKMALLISLLDIITRNVSLIIFIYLLSLLFFFFACVAFVELHVCNIFYMLNRRRLRRRSWSWRPLFIIIFTAEHRAKNNL